MSSGIKSPPQIVWEPEPRDCRPETLPSVLESARLVKVLSPNHLELSTLFGHVIEESCAFDCSVIERFASLVLDSGVGPNGDGLLVVRAAEHGCYVLSRAQQGTWLPAYYKHHSGNGIHPRVIDPTGAGNAFLGSFCVGLQETNNAVDAAMYGNVGASFAIEQIGFPMRTVGLTYEEELWNSVVVRARLHSYRLGLQST